MSFRSLMGKDRTGFLGKDTYNTTQSGTNIQVPVDATYAIIKCWGAGGGCGGYESGASAYRGDGSCGGYSQAQIAVTSQEILILHVGEGGPAGGVGSNGSYGGDGGGYTGVFRGATPLIIAGAGGGGGSGGGEPSIYGGAGGDQSSGGSSPMSGGDGTYLEGGGSGTSAVPGGGNGYPPYNNDGRGSGGGGGAGYYGGGAGETANDSGEDKSGGGAGGGGSGYVTGTNTQRLTSTDQYTPPNTSDIDYDGVAGKGYTSSSGGRGLVVIYWYAD
jgi:Glycine rich protein